MDFGEHVCELQLSQACRLAGLRQDFAVRALAFEDSSLCAGLTALDLEAQPFRLALTPKTTKPVSSEHT